MRSAPVSFLQTGQAQDVDMPVLTVSTYIAYLVHRYAYIAIIKQLVTFIMAATYLLGQ